MNAPTAELIRPRVANYPKYTTSAGGEIIDLMADLNRPLDPWQGWIIERGLGQNPNEFGELEMAADTCGCWVPRQNGKGDIIMALEVGWLFLFGIPLIGHSAHLYSTASEGFVRIKTLIEENEHILGSAIKRVWSANGKQGIELTAKYNRARLLFMAREGGQGLGFSFPRLIFDEAQALNKDLMQTILPTMSAQADPQAWFFGTPPRSGKAWIYQIKEAGEGCATGVAWFDYGIEYIDPTTPEFREVVGSPETNRATNPSMGARRGNGTGVRQKAAAGEMAKLGLSIQFAQERNGMWLPRERSTEEHSIDPQVWARHAATPALPPDIVLALHVNAKRTHGTIVWVGKFGEVWRVGIADHRPGVDWMLPRVAELRGKYAPIAVTVDARGEGQLEELKKIGVRLPDDPFRPKRGQLILPRMDDVASAFSMLVDAANAQLPSRIQHHNEPPMNAAIAAPMRPLGRGGTFDHKAGVEVGPACAAGLGMWAYTQRVDKITDDYDPLAFIH